MPRRLLWTLPLLILLPRLAAAADGNLDTSFHGDGKVVVGADPEQLYFWDLVEAPDGALAWVGFRRTNTNPVVSHLRWVRATDSGQSLCELSLAAGASSTGLALAFDASGRLVVAGSADLADGTDRLLFARYLYPACTLDSSFDGDGVRLLDVGNSDSASVDAVATDGDSIVFAGVVRVEGADDTDGVIGRLAANGAVDPLFASAGLATIDARAGRDYLRDLVLTPERIYAGGWSQLPDQSDQDLLLVALDRDGDPVPGFGFEGMLGIDLSDVLGGDAVDDLNEIELAPDGGVVLAGDSYNGSEGGGFLVKVDPQGELDGSFDGDGVQFDATLESIRGIAIQGDGRIVVGGHTFPTGSFLLRRRLANGQADPTFAGGATAPAVFAEGGYQFLQGLELQAGRPVVGGILEGNGLELTLAAVARYTSSFVFVDGFELGAPYGWSEVTP